MGFSGEKSLKQDKKLKKQNNCCVSEKKCHCKDESSFSPIKSKMKVLKKIKRRIGLGLYIHSSIRFRIVLQFFSFNLFLLCSTLIVLTLIDSFESVHCFSLKWLLTAPTLWISLCSLYVNACKCEIWVQYLNEMFHRYLPYFPPYWCIQCRCAIHMENGSCGKWPERVCVCVFTFIEQTNESVYCIRYSHSSFLAGISTFLNVNTAHNLHVYLADRSKLAIKTNITCTK